MTIYLLKYNNYYNRTIKRWTHIEELLDRDDVLEIGTFENVNFNPGDGVATQLTLNYLNLEAANYLVVEDTTSLPNITSLSSWFILDAQFVRLGQYQLSLRRDLVNDLWHILADSPMFIEKATLSASSPLLFNHEDMTFNQIKTSEFPLYDETQSAWIVGYLEKGFSAIGDDKITIPAPIVESQIRGEFNSWEEYDYADMINTGQICGVYDSSITYVMEYFYTSTTGYRSRQLRWDRDKQPPASMPTGGKVSESSPYLFLMDSSRQKGYLGSVLTGNNYYEPFIAGLNETSFADLPYKDYIGTKLYTQDDLTEIINSENGAIYKVGGKIYKITITATDKYTETVRDREVPQNSALGLRFQVIGNKMLEAPNVFQRMQNNPFMIDYTVYGYSVSYSELPNSTIEINIPNNHPQTLGAPYDIFCIPYGSVGWGGDIVRTSKEYSWNVAQAIVAKAGATGSQDSKLYDLQLLPYCPIRDRMKKSVLPGISFIEPRSGDITVEYTAPNALVPTIYAAIAWVDSSDLSFTIEASKIPGLTDAVKLPDTAVERKVAHETDMFRLTSPNYNGAFEFSVIKNGGLDLFDVDCSYKPIQPYIRISPRFGGLYGKDFNDARGLILGGDFSLPQMGSAWTSYQNSNKNYQVMFDRQIENIDINNSVQRTMEIANLAVGALQGGTTAAMAGTMTKHPVSLGITAGVVGGAASLGGGLIDLKLNEKLRQEARDYTIDQFGYQLGNIQARPDSLTKVSSFNPNNKLFPVLEYYTATDVEKEALRNKLRYNGMTVMVIGTISEYLQIEPSYIKGRLIRMNSDYEDYHIVNALSDELYQGVFV